MVYVIDVITTVMLFVSTRMLSVMCERRDDAADTW